MTTVIQYGVDAVSLAGLYALVAIGVAMVFGIVKLINFAHAELIMFTAYAMLVLSAWSSSWVIWLLGSLVTGVVLAVIMERVAFRPIRGASPTTMLIASFSLAIVLRSIVSLITNNEPRTLVLPGFVNDTFVIASIHVQTIDVVIGITAAVSAIGLALFLKRTRLGLQMRAAGEDFRMTQYLGVRADVVVAGAFAVSGVLAAIVGVMLVAKVNLLVPEMGLQPVLIGFVAVVIGGMGSLIGAGIGGCLLGIFTVVLQATLPEDLRPMRDAFVFALVILILVLRPQGLFGSSLEEERV